ncbi:MAG TPA: O-acetyl-ADP-ribose deacetylase [bacterium]|nr:O-acetyl-ADP-ribose deacetylase [bacterium]
MEIKVGKSRLGLKPGDITKESVDAIVNAANTSLLGGGGVDGAIHRAGGPAILEECRKLGGCRPGNAKITAGGRLPARHVIHTVGPIWHGGGHNEEATLASAYRRSLEVARENGLSSVSFPSISTGAYGFPLPLAARTALGAIMTFLKSADAAMEVTMVLFSAADLKLYEEALKEVTG